MPGLKALTTYGLAPQLANVLGGSETTGLTATGSAQTDALPISNGLNVFSTVSLSTGARLPKASDGSIVIVVNGGANALAVYPATGEKINNGTATTGSFSVTNAKNAIFVAFNGQWGAGLFA